MINPVVRQFKSQEEADDLAQSYEMKIYVSSSGTQYVNAADLLFDDREKFKMYVEAKEAAKPTVGKR